MSCSRRAAADGARIADEKRALNAQMQQLKLQLAACETNCRQASSSTASTLEVCCTNLPPRGKIAGTLSAAESDLENWVSATTCFTDTCLLGLCAQQCPKD